MMLLINSKLYRLIYTLDASEAKTKNLKTKIRKYRRLLKSKDSEIQRSRELVNELESVGGHETFPNDMHSVTRSLYQNSNAMHRPVIRPRALSTSANYHKGSHSEHENLNEPILQNQKSPNMFSNGKIMQYPSKMS